MGMRGSWTLATYVAKGPGMLWPHADLVGPRGCLSHSNIDGKRGLRGLERWLSGEECLLQNHEDLS